MAIERNLFIPPLSVAPSIAEKLNGRPRGLPNRPFVPQVRHGPVGPNHFIDGEDLQIQASQNQTAVPPGPWVAVDLGLNR